MLGVDIESIVRFDNMIANKRYKKILTKYETEYFIKNGEQAKILAGFWCAKEAIVKALGCGFGEISYLDVEIRHDDFDRPYGICQKLGLVLEVSISHCETYAVAVAMLASK